MPEYIAYRLNIDYNQFVMKEHTAILMRYKLEEGGQADIWVASQGKTLFVLKFFEKSDSLQRERSAYEALRDHSTLFPVYEGVVSCPSDLFYPNGTTFIPFCQKKQFFKSKQYLPALKLEYIPFGDLSFYIPYIDPINSERICRRWCGQIIQMLKILKTKNISHRDLKPSNLLVTGSGRLKLCDFGCSQSAFENGNKTMKKAIKGQCGGTAAYMPPEMNSQNPLFAPIEVDYYTFGLVAFQLLLGNRPFQISSLQDSQYRLFIQCPKEFWSTWKSKLKLDKIEQKFMVMIQTLLHKNREMRGRAEDLLIKKGAFQWLNGPVASDQEIQEFVDKVRALQSQKNGM